MIQNTSDAVQWKDENSEFKQRTSKIKRKRSMKIRGSSMALEFKLLKLLKGYQF